MYQGLEPRRQEALIAAPGGRLHGRFGQLGDEPGDDCRRRREDAPPLHRRTTLLNRLVRTQVCHSILLLLVDSSRVDVSVAQNARRRLVKYAGEQVFFEVINRAGFATSRCS